LRLRGGAMPGVVGVVVSADEDAPDVLQACAERCEDDEVDVAASGICC
jgi:hypothetical protein